MFKNIISNYITRENLLDKEGKQKVLVALSGGADSVALLCVLRELHYHCVAVHCNFHLRGEESNRDEAFVRHLCTLQHVPLHVVHFDTESYAAEQRISIEMAARQLRYERFEQIRQEEEAEAIAVAHHRDDSVETVLLNLIRGTGINGLKGIRPRNGRVVRPLLCVSRQDILNYLSLRQQTYVTDSTNLHDEYTRNKIRLNLLPMMQTINPSVSQSIAATATRLAEVATLYNQVMEKEKTRVMHAQPDGSLRIDIPSWQKSAAPQSLLYEVLSPLGFNAAQLDDIAASASAQPGRIFRSSTHEVLKDRDCWLAYPLPSPARVEEEHLITSPQGCIHTSDGHTLSWETVEAGASFSIPRTKDTLCLDAERTGLPLTLRRTRQGDRFIPFGMKGKKLVSDYLTDRKFPLYAKQRQWVLQNDAHLLWLAGERSDERGRIKEGCKRIILFNWKQDTPSGV